MQLLVSENQKQTLIDYKLAKVKIVLKNGKLISDDNHENTYVSVALIPELWGSKTSDGNSIVGVTDYGFTGSLDDALSEATEGKSL